jgi:hypothetical protein
MSEPKQLTFEDLLPDETTQQIAGQLGLNPKAYQPVLNQPCRCIYCEERRAMRKTRPDILTSWLPEGS